MRENWICNHLGARAHYEMAKALFDQNRLKVMITEVWIRNRSLARRLAFPPLQKIMQRYHPGIPNQKVISFNTSAIFFELKMKALKLNGWELILKRNNWYQSKVAEILNEVGKEGDTLFSFAYTSLKPFKAAEAKALNKVLYQMDPGLWEEEIVAAEYSLLPEIKTNWRRAPKDYWVNWKEECALADRIIVNSEWSRFSLEKVGIDSDKIKVIPLPLELPEKALNYNRQYPDRFTKERPLKVLFLGTLTVRKGIHKALEAAARLLDLPVKFIFVGNKEFDFEILPNMAVYEHVSRKETDSFYKDADVFLFPTLSDGFGLTQLEALIWQLPLISSKFCGDVVKDNVNGVLLKENSVSEIIDILKLFISSPEKLKDFSLNSIETLKGFKHDEFAANLTQSN